jgi:hypothetical protein
MHAVLCILLFLQTLVCGGTYTTAQVSTLEQQNEQLILDISRQPDLMNSIEQNYGTCADEIVIIDSSEN